jgi:hypothetical protein
VKLVILSLLEDDIEMLHALLGEHGVVAYSELPVEGHGAGTTGWYGEIAPYRSQMVLAFMAAAPAKALLEAVAACTECKDRRHPVRAWMLDVERAVVPLIHSESPEPTTEQWP